MAINAGAITEEGVAKAPQVVIPAQSLPSNVVVGGGNPVTTIYPFISPLTGFTKHCDNSFFAPSLFQSRRSLRSYGSPPPTTTFEGRLYARMTVLS